MFESRDDIRIDTMVTIPLERYDELIRKEFVYDYQRRELTKSIYFSERDKLLFNISDEEVKEDK